MLDPDYISMMPGMDRPRVRPALNLRAKTGFLREGCANPCADSDPSTSFLDSSPAAETLLANAAVTFNMDAQLNLSSRILRTAPGAQIFALTYVNCFYLYHVLFKGFLQLHPYGVRYACLSTFITSLMSLCLIWLVTTSKRAADDKATSGTLLGYEVAKAILASVLVGVGTEIMAFPLRVEDGLSEQQARWRRYVIGIAGLM